MNFLTSFKGLSGRIWLLAFVNFVNRCGAMIICFLTLYITESLHYSIVDAGYAMAIYGLGAILGQQIGGYLSDKIGYQRVQLLSLISTGVVILCLVHVQNFYLLCAVLFILNTCSESFRPANSVAVTMNSTEEDRTRSFSLHRVAFNLAITMALTIGGWLITKNWKYIFWADAFTCFASAATLFFLVPEVHKINKSSTVQTQITDTSKSPYADKKYMQFMFATFLGALAFMQLIWTVPPFFKNEYHWNEFTIGCVAAINGFVVMIIEMPTVHRIQAIKPTLWIIKLGIIIYAFSYLMLLMPINFMWVAAILYMVFISIGEVLVMPFSITWVTLRSPKLKQGKYMSVYGIGYALANVLAPLMGTQIIDRFGYSTLWICIAAISMVAWLIFNSLKSDGYENGLI